VPVALLAMAMTVLFVPESKDPSVPALDRPGLAVSVAMLGSLTYTIIEAPDRGWLSAATLGGFAVAALLLAWFVRIERRVAHPMLDVTLFSDRRFSAASGAVTISFFALFGFIFLITQFFQFVRHDDALSTGLRILPVAGSLATASVLGGLLAPRLGTKLVVATGMTLLGSAFLWIADAHVTTSYASVIVPQMVLMGTGLGLITTPATESILRVLPPARAGVGSAVNDATRELGGTLGVAVIGSLFSSVYAARLATEAGGLLDGRALAGAQDSVGAADAMAARVPALRDAMDTAFLAGLHTSCLVIGALCLLGAVAALVALPGNGYRPQLAFEPAPDAEPIAALEG
jgi:hypothetical protein